jgi:hypothetical protein
MMNDNPQAIDLTMTALAHPARRAILERVMRRENARDSTGCAICDVA